MLFIQHAVTGNRKWYHSEEDPCRPSWLYVEVSN